MAFFGNRESSVIPLLRGYAESPAPVQWVTADSAVPEAAEEPLLPVGSPSVSLSCTNSIPNDDQRRGSLCRPEGDSSCPRDEEEVQQMMIQTPSQPSAFRLTPSSPIAPGLRTALELGASAPYMLAMPFRQEECKETCSNPRAHTCLACRQKQMEEEFHQHVPGYLAAERGSNDAPCCTLSSDLHTIVHVCACMAPVELDRALAVENLRLERVRDAYAVVLTIAKKYGIKTVLDDADLMLIVYKYDEMMRMYAMMTTSVALRRRQSYFRRVTSSFLPDSPGDRKKKGVSPEDNLRIERHPTQEMHQDPTLDAPGVSELEQKLRDAMRQHFTVPSLDVPASTHVSKADTSWHLAVQEPSGLKIFFRRHAGSTLISFRVEGTVDASILNIISVLNEMDLYQEWIPYYSFPLKMGLRGVTKLYQFGRVEQINLLQLDFPWPMNNRDCCVEIWAADDLDYTNRFFIRITSLDGGTDNPRVPVSVPMPPHKTLRLYVDGAVILAPLGADNTFIELVWTLDPKVHLSDYIVNFFTKVFAKSSFQAFCKVCVEASGGEHARRRQNFPLLYGFVEKRLVEVEKAYERIDLSMSPSHDAYFSDGSPGHVPKSPLSAAHSKVYTDALGTAKEGDESKKTRSGKISFPFRRRRSSLVSGTANS